MRFVAFSYYESAIKKYIIQHNSNKVLLLEVFEMTVCIAAINNEHKIIAFATDRMVTASLPPIEFEHSIPKLTEISNHCVSLSAGDAIRGKEIFEELRHTVTKTNINLGQMVQCISEIYRKKRLQIAEALFLRVRGLSHSDFIQAGAKLLPPPIYAQIDHGLATFNLQVEAIIAGVDDSGPAIYGIHNPGIADCYNSIGFHAVGTGAMHALISLIETYSPNFSPGETLYSVYRAKRIAEVAPGVGQDTDLGIIEFNQKLKYFGQDSDVVKKFAKLYEDEKSKRKTLIMNAKLATLNLAKEDPSETPRVADSEHQPKLGKVKE
jgi:hypothetical protein